MSNNYRWIAVVGALLLAAMVGFAAYQAGVEHGIEQSSRIVAPPSGVNASPYPYPYPYPYYGWHRPWGFGFFPIFPLFFLFWFLVVRGLFWRRAGYGGGGCGPRGRFEEWHRQAHERDAAEGTSGVPGER
jgi:hypothetical protein